MRPECGEQKTNGAVCERVPEIVKGGVSSDWMEARSFADMDAARPTLHNIHRSAEPFYFANGIGRCLCSLLVALKISWITSAMVRLSRLVYQIDVRFCP